MRKILTMLLAVLCFSSLNAAKVQNLKCEYQSAPMGVDILTPHLSWNIISSKRGVSQTAYQILVASSEELLRKDKGDCWDSGRVSSDQSIQLPYEGQGLESFNKYYWKVRIWDESGNVTSWSKPAQWAMGILNPEAWGGAEWIARKPSEQWQKEWNAHKAREAKEAKLIWPWFNGKWETIWDIYEAANPKYDPAPIFRKEFDVKKRVKSATLYISGLGYYEAFLNGERVGDHYLDPAWTNFQKRSFYATHDVTKMVSRGENALGIMVGRGQYNPLCNDIWKLNKSAWVDQPKAIAHLRILYTDGSVATVITDKSWKAADSPVVYDDTRIGELYDARKEQPGWNKAKFNSSSWSNVHVVEWNAPLCSQMMPPIRCFEPQSPIKIYNKGEGKTIYDIGKNFAGWARIKVTGPAGAKVLVEYCELPYDEEITPYVHPSRKRYTIKEPFSTFYDKGVNTPQQNGYILRGEGTEEFECHFSYKGFRYVRVTVDSGVDVKSVVGVPVHTDVASAGEFTCSNQDINNIQQAARTTLLSNFHSIPTDCPTREKQGWTADAYMTAQTAIYNFDMAGFYTKWINDLAGTQTEDGGLGTVAPSTKYDSSSSTVWPAAIVYVPTDLYNFYGDRREIEKQYDVMKGFAKSSQNRQIEGKQDIIREVLGDWLSPKPNMEINENELNDSHTMVPPEGLVFYGSASHYDIVKKIGSLATLLGKNEDAKSYESWANRIAKNFNKEFFDTQKKTYHGEKPTTEYRQSTNSVALDFGLVPSNDYSKVLDNLKSDIKSKDGRMGTGFVGTMAIMDFLPKADPELAYLIATQPQYPGWTYMIRTDETTTLWESWDGGSSRNHPPFCLISKYYYKHLAGIQYDPAQPGFKHIIIAPQVVGDLQWVKGSHTSMYGEIRSEWELKDGNLTLEIEVPANCTATVWLPTKEVASIKESGDTPTNSAEWLGMNQEGAAGYRIGSGVYHFTTKF